MMAARYWAHGAIHTPASAVCMSMVSSSEFSRPLPMVAPTSERYCQEYSAISPGAECNVHMAVRIDFRADLVPFC
jgi:hypothetical protein